MDQTFQEDQRPTNDEFTEPSAIKLGLVIDLDICVGCQACVVNCKEWNTSGYGAPLSDENAYGANPNGAWLNRVHAYEAALRSDAALYIFQNLVCIRRRTLVKVAQRVHPLWAEDGIVLVNEEWCIGCGLCAWSAHMVPWRWILPKA